MDYPNLIFLKNIHTDRKRVTLISFGWWDMGKFYFVLYVLFRFSEKIYIRIICREKVIYKLIPWNFHSCFISMLLFIERSQTKKLVSSLQPSHQKLIRIIFGTNMNVKLLFLLVLILMSLALSEVILIFIRWLWKTKPDNKWH